MTEPADAFPACALCGRPGAPLHRELGDRLFDVPGKWSLLSCEGCGLVFLDPMPSADRIGALYESYYTHEPDEPEDREASRLRRAASTA